MLISDIARETGYEMVGEDCDVDGISWFESAKETQMAVVKRKQDFNITKAKAVLTRPVIFPTDKTLLITFDDIETALVRVCKAMIDYKILPDYSTPTKYTMDDSGYYLGKNCNISPKAIIQPGVMIGDNVTVGAGTVIEPFVCIGSGTIIEENVYIGSGSKIGVPSFYHYYEEDVIHQFDGCGTVKIATEVSIGSNTIVQRGTLSDTFIGANSKIGNCIDIGHDVQIGRNCKIVSQTGIAGDVTIKDNVTIYGQAGISNNLVIGNNAVIKGRSIITKSVKDNSVVFGPFGRNYYDEIKLIAKMRKFFEGKED